MLLSLCTFCFAFSWGAASWKFHAPPKYVIDLDKPPQERWSEVVRDYREQMKKSAAVIIRRIPRAFHDRESHFRRKIKDFFPAPFLDEIKGMKMATNLTYDELIYPNIAYELFTYCTSILTRDKDGVIWHARNMDYIITKGGTGEITDMLRDMTIRVDFQKGGKTVYTGITFAGYVGLVTGQRPNAFTISVNARERKESTVQQTIQTGFGNQNVKLVSLLVRQVLENAPSFGMAEHQLAYAVTAAEVYFILGGVRPNEGTVITKGRTVPHNIRRLHKETGRSTMYAYCIFVKIMHLLGGMPYYKCGEPPGRWYLVQTNDDRWLPATDPRRNNAIKLVENMGRNVTKKKLFGVLSTYPVRNEITVYQVVMSAAKPGLFTTRVVTLY